MLTRDHAHVTNEAGYASESVTLWNGRLLAGAGVRFDEFRYAVTNNGVQSAGRWQGKGNAAFTPSRKVPLTFHVNYGRGINSIDARGVVQRPDQPRLATTDFYQAGVNSNVRAASLTADVFLIDHSNEQVYIPDDGSFEFKGPSRAYGLETKASVPLTQTSLGECRPDENRERFLPGWRPSGVRGQRTAFCRQRGAGDGAAGAGGAERFACAPSTITDSTATTLPSSPAAAPFSTPASTSS